LREYGADDQLQREGETERANAKIKDRNTSRMKCIRISTLLRVACAHVFASQGPVVDVRSRLESTGLSRSLKAYTLLIREQLLDSYCFTVCDNLLHMVCVYFIGCYVIITRFCKGCRVQNKQRDSGPSRRGFGSQLMHISKWFLKCVTDQSRCCRDNLGKNGGISNSLIYLRLD
jgi:hypothetical protein